MILHNLFYALRGLDNIPYPPQITMDKKPIAIAVRKAVAEKNTVVLKPFILYFSILFMLVNGIVICSPFFEIL
jgi:hypothetical protein